jgi:hypothetical protein
VHAYYSVYGALQAWFAANGMTGIADDHAATLRSIATMNQQRNLLPAPWGVLCVRCPMRKERRYLNEPAASTLADHIEVLAVPNPDDDADFWPRYGTWLRSTREARLEAREADWKRKNNRKKISTAARTQIAGSLAPTSVFDCFWRMRIRSNYGSVDQFLALHVDEREHLAYFRAICSVTRATLALLEIYVARKVGRDTFAELVTDFLAGDENNIADKTLRSRAQRLGWL